MQDAALDPTKWESALDLVNTFVGGSGAVILTVDERLKYAPASTGLSEFMSEYFERGWYTVDLREPCIPLLKERGVVFDHEFQEVEEMERCDYYQDFMARHRLKWFAGLGVEVNGDFWCLALQRSPEKGPFDASDLTRLALVRGFLGDAATLSQALGRFWISGMQNALDLVGQAGIIFDHQGRVVNLNEAARCIVGPYIDRDQTVLPTGETKASFVSVLRGAIEPTLTGAGTRRTHILKLGQQDYFCRITSLLGHASLIASGAAALALIHPLAPPSLNQAIRARFRLTAAETRVSLAISEGKSVRAIAEQNRVKAESVRAQLKAVYAKTDTHTQAQLVSLFMRLRLELSGR